MKSFNTNFPARSFAQGSRLLLLDEAASSLDIRSNIEVFDLFAQENSRNNRTVLSIVHGINLAAMYLNRLIFLKEGGLVAEEKTEEVLTPKILGDVYETRVLVKNHPVTGRPFILS
jgi:iron complex transport system ATP-binding protein